jgi:tRNA modification GTPase
MVTDIRHKNALLKAYTAMKKALRAIGASEEFIALDLRQALDALGEIVGETTTEDILDRVFSRFCVGK